MKKLLTVVLLSVCAVAVFAGPMRMRNELGLRAKVENAKAKASLEQVTTAIDAIDMTKIDLKAFTPDQQANLQKLVTAVTDLKKATKDTAQAVKTEATAASVDMAREIEKP